MNEGGERVRITVEPLGAGFLDHNLTCWLCEKRPAVYSANPRWVFQPCLQCQDRMQKDNPDAWWDVNDTWDYANGYPRWTNYPGWAVALMGAGAIWLALLAMILIERLFHLVF